jgi:hypothetical protein
MDRLTGLAPQETTLQQLSLTLFHYTLVTPVYIMFLLKHSSKLLIAFTLYLLHFIVL